MPERITIHPDICNGRPVIRGTRITAQTVLEFPAAGDSVEDVLEEYPSLTDTQIWDYARQRELVIVAKDADFSGRIILSTPPPWVVHLRFSNLRRRDFHAWLARVWPQVEALLKTNKLVHVYLDRLEGVS